MSETAVMVVRLDPFGESQTLCTKCKAPVSVSSDDWQRMAAVKARPICQACMAGLIAAYPEHVRR